MYLGYTMCQCQDSRCSLSRGGTTPAFTVTVWPSPKAYTLADAVQSYRASDGQHRSSQALPRADQHRTGSGSCLGSGAGGMRRRLSCCSTARRSGASCAVVVTRLLMTSSCRRQLLGEGGLLVVRIRRGGPCCQHWMAAAAAAGPGGEGVGLLDQCCTCVACHSFRSVLQQ